MAIDIKSLLKKKSWTGEEVGKAIIFNLINDYRQALQGVEHPTELFNKAQIDTMLNSITDRTQRQLFNRYIGLNNWISQNHAIATARYEQVRGEINRLLLIISTSTAAEDEYQYIEQLPAIMTQKQYDEIRAARIEEQLTAKDGKDLAHGVFNLLELAIEHFVSLLQKEPKKANPLKSIKKKYQTEPINSKRILSCYNEIMGEGYYSLPDGRRSDQMSCEEWQRELTTPEEYDKQQEIAAALMSGEYSEDVLKNIPLSDEAMNRALERNRAIFNGATEEEANNLVYEAAIEKGLHPKTIWHTYEEPPEDLTKWDIIENIPNIGLHEFYPVLVGETTEADSYTTQVEDFKAEFSELCNVVLSEIDNRYFKGGEGIGKLPIMEWEDTVFPFRELYNEDFFGFRNFIERDTSIFEGNQRALVNGIAILRPSDTLNKSLRIDKLGYYTEPEHNNSFSSVAGLEKFTPLNEEDYLSEIEELETSRKLIEDGYYFLLGYDKAIELIASYIDLPDFCLFKINAPVLTHIESLNNLVFMLYAQIKETDYIDKRAKERKLQVLQDYFQPISGSGINIPEAAIAEAQALLEGMEAFRVQDNVFLKILTTPKEEA